MIQRVPGPLMVVIPVTGIVSPTAVGVMSSSEPILKVSKVYTNVPWNIEGEAPVTNTVVTPAPDLVILPSTMVVPSS